MHRVLKRQVERAFGHVADLPEQVKALVELVNDSYQHAEEDRRLNAAAQELASSELREANLRLQGILAAFPDLFLQLDRTGRVLACQGGDGLLSGRSVWDMAGKHLDDTLLGAHAGRLLAAAEEARTSDAGLVVVDDIEVDGAFYEGRVVCREDGPVVVVLRDVTERRHALVAEDYLRSLLSSTLDALPMSIAIVDADARVVATNRSWDELAHGAGLASRNPAWNYLDVCRAAAANGCEDGERVAHGLEAVLAGDAECFHHVYECAPSDRWFHLHIRALDADCDARAVLVHEDVTATVLSKRAVVDSEARLQSILASTADGILGFDASRRVAFANPACERLLSRSRDQLVGAALTDVFGGATDNLLHRLASEPFEIQHEVPGGGQLTLEITGAHDRLGGGVVSLRDATQRAKLQSQLAQAQKFEAIGQLAAGVAHEINTPTQYIGDNVRFLRDAFDDLCKLLDAVGGLVESLSIPELEPIRELRRSIDLDFLREECPQAINQTLDGVERVSQIVYSMKDFAHPDRGERSMVDLNRVVQSATSVCRNEWKYVADLALELDPSLPAVLGYRSDLGQVVLNLVVNAAHAIADVVGDGSGGRGRITVRTRAADRRVVLEVQDTGTGISEAHRMRIFEQFFTTKPVGRGTGQGLALIRRIVVDKHGGAIDFATEVGCGTTFRIELPLE